MATIPNNQKILTSAPEVNTTYGGPASLQALNTWYTMEDIANTVRPYKVYTALLTQSGGDNPSYVDVNTGAIVIGTTYEINDAGDIDWDFTNIGAPSNNPGTKFVATGVTPNIWGNGILDYNTGAPVVTVLENTIGNIWFEYSDVGEYFINSDGIINSEKTTVFVGCFKESIAPVTYGTKYNGSGITLTTADDLVPSDALLSETSIEIRVYN